MATFASDRLVDEHRKTQASMTPERQAQISTEARRDMTASAKLVGALVEHVLLGPPSIEGAAAWCADCRSQITRLRVGPGMGNGAPELLKVLSDDIDATECAAAEMIAERDGSERWVGDNDRTLCGDRLRAGARRLCGDCANAWADARGEEPRGCGAQLT